MGNLFCCSVLGIAGAGIVFIFFGMSFIFEDNDFQSETILCAITLLIAALGIGLGIYGEIQSARYSEWTTEQIATESIVTLQDNSRINGRFYMKRGYLNSEEYYHYLVKMKNGGYKANKVKTASATIFEANSNYRVEWYTRTRGYWFTKEIETFYYIYIPEGSISFDYSVDLQ